jgi:hypothetical protein
MLVNTTPGAADPIGSADGEIASSLVPNDSDTFSFLSPGKGTATFSLKSRDPSGGGNPSSFQKTLEVYDVGGNLLATASAGGTDTAQVSIVADQGTRFYIVASGEDGFYTVEVSGVPRVDDKGDESDWLNAFDIDKDLYDYDGTESVFGIIENAGDTDIFSFTTINWDTVSIEVVGLDASMRPVIDIYEVSVDPDGNPIFLRIAHGGEGTATAALTAPPRTSTANSITYNTYFVVVSTQDRFLDFGNYLFTINFGTTTDDHPDEDQWDLAHEIPIDTGGAGLIDGDIELAGDSDLFIFTAQAAGQVTITVAADPGSTIRPQVRVFNFAHGVILDQITNTPNPSGPDAANSTANFEFTAVRGQSYFVLVNGVAGGAVTTETGSYDVGLSTPVPDDHPNLGDFGEASEIVLSPFSGSGSRGGELETGTDTDLFFFETIVDGDVTVTVTVPGNVFRSFVRFFDNDPSHNEIGVAVNDGGPGDEDGVRNGRVVRTLSGASVGEVYFILVSSDQTDPVTTGSYTVLVTGQEPPLGDDDHPNAGDWAIATPILLSTVTGDASLDAVINSAIDTDLFTFTSLAGSPGSPRKAFVQVLTPGGSPLDVGVTIFKGPDHDEIVASNTGTAGSNASVTFQITGTDPTDDQYWVLVSGINLQTGGYTLRIDTAPSTFSLYYPEGFRNNNIKEYVSIGNPSETEDVTYTVRLRFEDPLLGEMTIVSNALLTKNTRSGVTISNGTDLPDPGALNVPINEPYSIVIESTGFLAANISHYDFNSTVGEAFTSEPSTEWSFAKGTKFAGHVNDFLVYYNPNPTPARVTLRAFQPDGTMVEMAQIVDGFRRSGWNFNATAALPTGDFSFIVTSEPVNPGDEHIGIVAGLSHYDLENLTGYGVLGDPSGGATSGIVPQLLSRDNPTATSEITIFNSSDSDANIGLLGRYIGTSLPNMTRNITLGPKESITLDQDDLGLVNNQVMGLRYDSDVPVTVIGGTRQFGATDSTHANTEAATAWFWGDAFMNRIHAGTLYFEDMYFYNPTTEDLQITLDFQFSTGEFSSHTFTVGAKDFSLIKLHELPAILNHRVQNFFSIEASAAQPFVAKLTHYDLFLAGGWGTKGAPLGLTNPVSSII